MYVYTCSKVDMKNVIGNNIKSFRLILGRTLEEFASEIGVDPSYISRIENGSRNASSEVIQKICSIFGITANQIYATDFLAVLKNKGIKAPTISEVSDQ